MHNPTHRLDAGCDVTDHDAATLTTQRESSDTVRGLPFEMERSTVRLVGGGHLYALDRNGTLRWRFDSVAGLDHKNWGLDRLVIAITNYEQGGNLSSPNLAL